MSIVEAPRTTILDFPEELLLAVSDWLDVATLFLLLQVNRKLHQTYLPACLARYKIKDTEKHIKITLGEAQGKIDVISVLNLAFDLKSVDRITCKFKFVVPENHFPAVFSSIRRLGSWIRRLDKVKSVVLAFENDRCWCCATTAFKDVWLEEWSSAMGQLMSAISAKASEAIKVKGGRYMSHLFVFRYTTPSSSSKGITPFESIRMLFTGRKERKVNPLQASKEPLSVLKGDHWEFKRTKDSTVGPVLRELCPKVLPQSKLKYLNIQSMMFLMPPLLQWTISSLQYSNLRRLSLKDLSINHKCWVALFDLISTAAPGINELVLAKIRQVMPKDLLAFLPRLSRLAVFSLGRDVDSWDSYDLGTFPDLPKLITLHAPSVWTYKLLSTQPRGLERLESLTIAYKLRGDGLQHWLQHSSAPSIPALLQTQGRPLTVSVEVVMGSSPGWKMFEDLNSAQSEGVSTDVELITNMTFIVNQEFAKEDMRLWTVLPRWLELFRSLRYLSIVGRNSIFGGDARAVLEMVASTSLRLAALDVNGNETLFTGAGTGGAGKNRVN